MCPNDRASIPALVTTGSIHFNDVAHICTPQRLRYGKGEKQCWKNTHWGVGSGVIPNFIEMKKEDG